MQTICAATVWANEYSDLVERAEADQEASEVSYDATYTEVLASIESHGVERLSRDEKDEVLYSDADCISAAEAVVFAVLRRNGIEEARAELVKTWAKAVTDMREGV